MVLSDAKKKFIFNSVESKLFPSMNVSTENLQIKILNKF